jgi:transcriptional regulator with XRE-family HTH domain
MYKDEDVARCHEAFIRNISALKKESGLKWRDLLREVGIGENGIWVWRSGRFPTLWNLIALAEYFDVSLDELLGREKKHIEAGRLKE